MAIYIQYEHIEVFGVVQETQDLCDPGKPSHQDNRYLRTGINARVRERGSMAQREFIQPIGLVNMHIHQSHS